jgi:lysyl-tRNA synthetase class 2
VREIAYRFETTSGAGDVARSYAHLEPGEESGVSVVIAGRVMRSRPQGKLAFAEIRDWTGGIQLFALSVLTPEFDEFCRLSLGDWIGVTGEVVRTRRGELSVKVASWELLAQARRGFGDKWHGVSDPDIRYRQRELDLWANDGVRDIFLLRSKVVASIRRRLGAAGFVEVETPVLHPVAGGATARPFVTHYNALHTDVYLRIATELYLKRCVVGGLERVFEIGRTFRNEGLSPRHNPEFTMLELYQAYGDYTDMMTVFEDLVAGTAEELLGTTKLAYQGREIDLTPPWRRATLVELVAEHAGVEVELSMGVEALRRVASSFGVPFEPWYGPGKLILEIYEKTTESELWGPVFVCDYPQEVSPLARAHRSKPGYVERFEPIIAGRELGNAFSELTDPDDQRARFEEQEREKALGDEDAMSIDWDYLRALELGLPPTGGLGLGIDRLVMLYADVANIREVVLFPALRPEERPAEEAASGRPEEGSGPS